MRQPLVASPDPHLTPGSVCRSMVLGSNLHEAGVGAEEAARRRRDPLPPHCENEEGCAGCKSPRQDNFLLLASLSLPLVTDGCF